MRRHQSAAPALPIGRYILCDEIASGGMASVHLGRLDGPAGFSRVVAIKRMHAHYAKDPEFVTMFLQEARLAARIRHLNVVSTLDVVSADGEIFLVMDYVHGQSLASLWRGVSRAKERIDPRIVATVVSGALQGLHAAHDAIDERGRPLHIVHRDVSPQNILIGADGVARVLDFGVAKASGSVQTTRDGQIKGKFAYMPREQLQGGSVTRRSDVYSAGVVAWELLTGSRAFGGQHEAAVVTAVLSQSLPPPSQVASHVPRAFDAVIKRALSRHPARRYSTAREMALDLESCVGTAPLSEVADWVHSWAHDELARRAQRVARIERSGGLEPGELVVASAPRSASDIPTRQTTIVDFAPGEAPTVSRVAVSSTVSRARLPRPPRRVAAIASVVLVGALCLRLSLVPWTGGSRTPSESRPMAAAAVPATVDPPDFPAPTSGMAAEPPSQQPPAAPESRGPSRATPIVSPGQAPARDGSSHAASPSKRDCDPPYVIDEKGHKKYKAACFK